MTHANHKVKGQMSRVTTKTLEFERFLEVEDSERRRIGRRLAQARLEAGLTQQAMADLLHVHKNSIGNYENGRVPWELLETWGRLTGRSREWFLRGDEAAIEDAERLREVVHQEIQAVEPRLDTIEETLQMVLELLASRGRDEETHG